MAQNVEFKLKFTLDGKEHIIATTDDVKQLTKELRLANVSGDRLRDSLLKFNNISTAFQNAAQGLQELTGSLLELSDSYASQQVIETKLANNMHNTMDAREEDIESIRQLCEEQKQLGIIDDEVQMAGAQELATYLEKKSSLEALIPVMNDMLAQQYDFEASEESAAQIASMLGKVMEGQTAALSRYGYSFTEAQEQILKFGTEEERAAVLAEVVESSVGGMNEALRQTPAGQAKALADSFGDMKETIGAIVAPFEDVILYTRTVASGLNEVVTTATGIWGVVKAIQSLNLSQAKTAATSRLLAVHHGVQAAAQRLLAASGYTAGSGHHCPLYGYHDGCGGRDHGRGESFLGAHGRGRGGRASSRFTFNLYIFSSAMSFYRFWGVWSVIGGQLRTILGERCDFFGEKFGGVGKSSYICSG